MTVDEKFRLMDIAYRSKSGRQLTIEEMRFCSELLDKYPDEYKQLQREGANKAVAELNPLASVEDKQ